MDGIALGLVDGWARMQGKIGQMDELFHVRGIVDEDGKVSSDVRTYITAVNSARQQLVQLGEHLSRVGMTSETLTDYIDAEYRNGDGDNRG
jgi:hypothetical protein